MDGVCPEGWHESVFLGKCGGINSHHTCEQNDFMYGPSPCAPEQDLTCFSPTQLDAWNRICLTKFL
jgi:Plasmodium falciparum domain of unknown function (CPW_WPC)